MSKHTPGPWMVTRAGLTSSLLRVETDPGRPRLSSRGVVLASISGSAEAEANACLIATAPDMLAELKRLIDVVGDEDVDCIEAVIAKAEGQP